MIIKPNTFIVFEGLDATGKTTQIEQFKELTKGVLFTHQPSGGGELSQQIYKLTEAMGSELSPVARQYLHLAAHSQHYRDEIHPALEAGTPVVMDRCWWSTIAYGWFGHNLSNYISLETFQDLAMLPTCNALGRFTLPDLVFLFTEEYEWDKHNTPEVAEGYKHLYNVYAPQTIRVPKMSCPEWVTCFIYTTLIARGYATQEDSDCIL